MNKKTKDIIVTVLFIPLVLLYAGWIINKIYLFNPDHNWNVPFKFSPVATGILIGILAMFLTYLISMGKLKSTKYKMWGTSLILISLPFSDSLGTAYAILDENGFAYLSVLFFLPIIIIIGLILLLVGIFKKRNRTV